MNSILRIWFATALALCAAAALPRPAAAQGLTFDQSVKLLVPLSWQPLPGVPHQPNPVVIVGDALAIDLAYWPLAFRLALDGYTVQSVPLQLLGVFPIETDAKLLNDVITMMVNNGASKVHIIGHGQGAIVARSYIATYGDAHVATLISLAGPHKGTTVVNGAFLQYPITLLGCFAGSFIKPPACTQLTPDSSFLTALNQRPVSNLIYYMNVRTDDDNWVRPAENAFMANCNNTEPGAEPGCNIALQDKCPHHLVDHSLLPLDDKVFILVEQSLRHQKLNLGCSP